MKLTLTMLLFLLFAWAAAAQQANAPINGPSASGSGRSQATGVFMSSGRSSTIRILGAPTNQPNRGRNVECSPVEQEIAGLIIGPTDLCDR
jgi:hypothetical protein